jgi:hypothetical protein
VRSLVPCGRLDPLPCARLHANMTGHALVCWCTCLHADFLPNPATALVLAYALLGRLGWLGALGL